jgi:nitroimidazol reductase NimA-like FMN-containing flavoprotein (pyridoxamine 5'-phosphate oxidase superfamily)
LPDSQPETRGGDPASYPPLSSDDRTRHRRLREQGRADRAELHAVLRAGLIAHLGVLSDGAPMVVPTVYGFSERDLYVHGSVASQSLAAGQPVTGGQPAAPARATAAQATGGQAAAGQLACVTVTVVDGLVLARSLFEHAVNYRCAMIYGRPRVVDDPAEKLAGLRLVSEHAAPGQWDYARRPSRKELAATRLLALSLEQASVKIRTGPPDDGDSPDAALGLWAGELPLRASWQRPRPDPSLPAGITVPAHIQAMSGQPASAPPG